MIELERTYLAKSIPKNLKNYESKDIIDIYFPKNARHPTLRVRKIGNKYEITKKEPVDNDPSYQKEQTIPLTKEEFNELSKLDGRKTHKIRYYYNYNNKVAEIDVFQGPLHSLIIVDLEFNSIEEKDSFEMPEFCLVDITSEEFIAGGMICGKSYEDIENNLKKYNYSKLFIG